jgi:lysyl-tRNA synthetase class 2
MDFTEQLFAHIAREVCGSTIVTYQGIELDLTPGKWTRLGYHEALEKIGGHKPEFYNDADAVRAYLRSRGEKYMEGDGLGKLQSYLFDLDVEDKLVQPTFIYAYPAEISPLARRNDQNPEITDRFEVFICGCEYGNAFSELNDPVDQRLRFEAQVAAKAAGDDEACPLDNDYLRALEYAMPPTAGEGVGIDRLTMLLCDEPSIREVLLFPLLRPEV